MPAITSGKVLITGANSFVGTWAARYLLEKGYSVRGVVRIESKGKYLKEVLFKEYGNAIEIAVIDDITRCAQTHSWYSA